MTEVDSVVSGGGVVGLATALALSGFGREVLVFDQSAPSTLGNTGMDLRSVALSPASIEYLQSLGMSSDVPGTPIQAMQVWERDGTASIRFESQEIGADFLATVFQNYLIVEFLKVLIDADPNIRIETSRIEAVDPVTQQLTSSDGSKVRCQLLVIAEGSNSHTAGLVGARRKQRVLNEHAVVSVLRMSQDHNGEALQRFGDTPLALLPYGGEQSLSMIWSVSDSEHQMVEAFDDAEFSDRVTESTEGCLGEVEEVDRRISFPLFHGVVEDMNPLSWVLIVGDAARTIHPLAGQGVNVGIEDVRGIGEVLDSNPRRLDEEKLWRAFGAKRKVRSMMMLAVMRGFSEVWKANGPYFRFLRNLGVRTVANSNSVRHQLMREAMGIAPLARSL